MSERSDDWQDPVPQDAWTPPDADSWRRRGRPREPWEDKAEQFEGAFALQDLACCGATAANTERVLARYFAVRVVLRAASGRARELLEAERRAAAAYVRRTNFPSDGEAARLTGL